MARPRKPASASLPRHPRRLRSFRTLLAETQHLVPLREEQVGEFTLPWPVMRHAVVRIGEGGPAGRMALAAEDVFLIRSEALKALTGRGLWLADDADTAARRGATREEQARLVPPLRYRPAEPDAAARLGQLSRAWSAPVRSDSALVSGSPASPGRASGPVRVIRGAHEFEALLPGETSSRP